MDDPPLPDLHREDSAAGDLPIEGPVRSLTGTEKGRMEPECIFGDSRLTGVKSIRTAI